MISLRLKTPARNSEWRCCYCLHVRTATILLGLWHIFLHLVALSWFAVIVRHRNLLRENSANQDSNGDQLSTLANGANQDAPYYLPQNDHSLYYPDLDMGAVVTMCTLAITLLLLYGAIKGKANHLLPFFCMQLFDFAITTLTATGYLCYLRSVHHMVAENYHLPWRNELLKLSPQCLSLLVLVLFLSIMLIKGYAIGIVWRCYKFLALRQQALGSSMPYIIPAGFAETQAEPDFSSLLPDYEAACAQTMKQLPPPSYQAAMAAQQSGATAGHANETSGAAEQPQHQQHQQQPQQQHPVTTVVIETPIGADAAAAADAEAVVVAAEAAAAVPEAEPKTASGKSPSKDEAHKNINNNNTD